MPILPTHKTTIEYLEHCRVQAADERLVYVKRKDALEQHFAIPYGNTSVLLLGPGTSLTQQAARLAASQGIVINVIENYQERLEALLGAHDLTRQILVVSARLFNQNALRGQAFNDGVLTQRNTFQKYFMTNILLFFNILLL